MASRANVPGPARPNAVHAPAVGAAQRAPINSNSGTRNLPGVPAGSSLRPNVRNSVLPQAVQPKMTIRNGSIQSLARAVIATGIVPQSKHNRVTTEIRYLKEGPENFGEVDLNNQQQVELVAYRLLRRIPRPERGTRHTAHFEIYDLAIIGAGSTAAYYLDTLGPAYDHSKTVVIGRENPWLRERGHGIPYINHTRRQIAMPSENVAEYGGNESFVDRSEFAQAGTAVIENRAGRWIQTDRVTKIKKLPSGVFQIDYTDRGPRNIKARKVIFAGGAGAQRKPTEVDDDAVHNRHRIIDMNTFIREKVKREHGRIVVWGSNAAIDAVAAARRHGWTIACWLYSTANRPAWLPGTRYLSPPYNLQTVTRHVYTGRTDIKIEDSEINHHRLRVRNTSTNSTVADSLDYVVYGLGSEDRLSGPGGILDNSVVAADRTLNPILDTAGVFDDPAHRGQQQSFLGWQDETGRFQVFGLAAENYAGVQGARGLERIAPRDARVEALKNWVSGDVLTVGQLTYIRSAVRAVNNYVPGSIEHRVDYSHADANILRVHLAARYPDLPERYAEQFISMIRTVRAGLAARLPHGFTREQVQYIEQELATKERLIKNRGTNSREDALQWKDVMALALQALTPVVGEEVRGALARMPEDDR